jgi:hypothetical protein
MTTYPRIPGHSTAAAVGAAISSVRRGAVPFLALAALGLTLRSMGLVVPREAAWVIVQQVFSVLFMIGYMGAALSALSRANSVGRLMRATPRVASAALRGALAVMAILALVLLPSAPLEPLAPRLAPWAWWTLAVFALLAPRVVRRIPHRLWWLLDGRAYRAAPGWDAAADGARAAVEAAWAAAYPDDDSLPRALQAALAFHERPAPDTGRLARAATRDARGAREAAEDAAARRHTRQTVAAAWVARAVEHVVRAMQPDADPRSWRWRRTEATDCLRIAEDTLRETMLNDLNKTLTEDLRLYMLLCRINDDPIVARFGLALNRGQLRRWLTYFRDGVAYMADAYGAESLPWDWGLVGGTAKDRWTFSRRAHMGYVPPSDTVHVSAANLAFQARSFDTDVRFMNHKLAPPGVTAEAFVRLEAVEECYHRYQFQALGMTGYSRRDDPIERDILRVWQKASDDLGLVIEFAGD